MKKHYEKHSKKHKNTGIDNSGVMLDKDCLYLHPVTVDSSNGYGVKRIAGRRQYVHRYITGAKDGEIVDHRNGNKLDNRRKNLWVVSKSENNRNRKTKGYVLTPYGKYQVTVSYKGRTCFVGNYETKREALAARYAVNKFIADQEEITGIDVKANEKTIKIDDETWTLSELKAKLKK